MSYIVTLFNSSNCGAFLQSYALSSVIEKLTGEVPIFINTGARSPNRSCLRKVCSAVKHLRFYEIPFALKKLEAYQSSLGHLGQIMGCKTDLKDDLVVFGSDEIWNVSRDQITQYPALWGDGLEGGWRISYAPSANGATFENFAECGGFVAQLRDFKMLSARDARTAEDVSNLLNRSIEVVCDPTLLLSLEDYRLAASKIKRNHFILVYSYGVQFAKDEIADIKCFARAGGYTLISADNPLKWCDESIPCGPFGFLSLMDAADYVVTDTFHGTVFATIFEKRFASYARNTKIASFLRMSGLEERNPIALGGLQTCLETPVDWGRTSALLDTQRKKSMAFLETAVKRWGDETGR